MNEIDLKNFKMTYLLQDIRKRLFLIISVALMAAMATFVLRNETYVATYTSEITFSVSTQEASTTLTAICRRQRR